MSQSVRGSYLLGTSPGFVQSKTAVLHTKPEVFTNQPQGPVSIDYNNPICQGLIEAILPDNFLSRYVVKGGYVPFTGTPIGPAISGRYGLGARQPSGASRVLGGISSNSDLTLLVISTVRGSAAALGAATIGQTSGGQMFKIFDADGTTPGLIYAQAHLGGAQRTFGGSFILEANQDYLAIARQKNGVSQDLWVNGVQDPIITNISGNAVAYSFYGRISTNTSQPLYLSVVWNRYLSDREVQSVSRNPWQVFKRPSTTIWTPA